jgi:predicted nucleic acid-binding protein
LTPKLALDTNAYRALDDGNSILAAQIKASPQIGLPITVLGELYYDIYLGSKRTQNVANLNRFLGSPRVEILHIDELTAKTFGEIATMLRKAGNPMQQNDIWIAAVCKQYGYILATADSGFAAITGLEVISF